MRKILSLMSLLTGLSTAAFADPMHEILPMPLSPSCATGVAWDSFHVGAALELMSGLPVDLRYMSSLNSRCVTLGREAGRDVKNQFLFGSKIQKSCERDFSRGQLQGRKFSSETGNDCFGVGYLLGVAELHDSLRRGDASWVTEACGRLYVKGISDARALLPSTPSANSALEQHCYDLGWFETHIATSR